MPTEAPRVMAGIVTYNPELERLKENVAAVVSQVAKVFIFDNGSENQDAVQKLAATFPGVEVFPCPENLGLSKALNTLGAACEDGGAEWAFFLDQDSVTSMDMVESLLQTALVAEPEFGPVGQVGPTIFERNLGVENIAVHDGKAYRPVQSLITSGSLVNLDAWRAVDGYDEDLFLDWVDIAFSFALRKAGYSVLLSSEACMVHEMGEREVIFHFPAAFSGVHIPFTFQEKDGRQVLFRYNYAPFRWYDQMKSQTIVLAKYGDTDDAGFVRFTSFCTFVRAVAFEKHRREVLKALVRGHRDGKAVACQLAGRA